MSLGKVLFRVSIAIAALIAVFWWFGPSGGGVEDGSVLVIDIAGEYVEGADPGLLARLAGSGGSSFVGLYSELRKAELDDRLSAVVLRIGGLEIGWAKAQEIREAIQKISASGKQTVALLQLQRFSANLEYYVASAADTVYCAPGANAPLVGLAAEYVFLGDAIQNLGIDLEVERIGKYKTAADMFSGTSMTEAHREMANSLLDSINEQFVGGIAESRGLTPVYVRQSIDRAPVTPGEMQALKLIDGIGFEDDVIELLGNAPVIEAKDYRGVALSGLDSKAKVALVYGSGNVVEGEGSSSPRGSPVFAAKTVSDALEEASKDDSIDAIILRIDSPGGSAYASDVVWRAIQRAKEQGKPVIASFSDVAASGGYYVAAGADAIVASPGTITGSIGVFAVRPVIRRALGKLDIGVASLTRGEHAGLQLASSPTSEATRARMRRQIESIYDLFVERVAEGRSLPSERVNELGRGRVWTGAQAAEAKLVDELGGLRTAVARARREIGLEEDDGVLLVPFPAPKSLVDQLNDALSGAAVRALPSWPLSELERIEPWLAAVASRGPALLPDFLVEIR